MNRMLSRIAVGIVAVTMASSVTPQSVAVVQKTGSTTCSTGLYVVIQAKGSGVLSFYYPSGTYRSGVDMGAGIGVWTVNTGSRSRTWKVTSTGYLDDVETRGYCSPSPARPS